MLLNYLATKIDVGVLGAQTPDVPTVDFCYCRYECDYVQKAFYEIGGEGYKNDTASFLFRGLIGADTIEMKLFKDDVEIDLLDNDDNGTFYDFGFNALQPLYKGYKLEFEKIGALTGPGVYQLKADVTVLGTTTTFESQKFRVWPWDEVNANGTIRIDTVQNGNIDSSDFDYTGMNWEQSMRIRGKFGDKQPEKTIDTYFAPNLEINQIQDSVKNVYAIETDLVPEFVQKLWAENYLLANSVEVINYNLRSFMPVYTPFSLYAEEYEGGQYFERNTRGKFTFKLTDKVQNIRKRNFT